MNGFTRNANHSFNSWQWSNLDWNSSSSVTVCFCILQLCGPAISSSRKEFVLILTLGKWQSTFDYMCFWKNLIFFWELSSRTWALGSLSLLSNRVDSMVTNFTVGRIQGGAIVPLKPAKVSLFTMFLQSGKQHLRYKDNFPSIVLSH